MLAQGSNGYWPAKPSRYEIQSQACADFGIQLTRNGILRGYASADRYMSEQNALLPLRARNPVERDKALGEYERRVLEGSGVNVSSGLALEIFHRLRDISYRLVLFEDVLLSLEALRSRGIILGLISNMDRDSNELLEGLGLSQHLDFAIISSEVGVDKPDPRIFQAALIRAGVRQEEAMHVGDQPISDVQGAIAAGISPVLLDRDSVHNEIDVCPRIESLLELNGLLR